MTSPELENLVGLGTLVREPPGADELRGLRQSGEARLTDATNAGLALESRFDLAYNAAHALALAALRRAGYRAEKRYAVFQVLPHTLGLLASTCRVLAKCHTIRNQTEYEGMRDIDERLVTDLIAAATSVRDALRVAEAAPEP